MTWMRRNIGRFLSWTQHTQVPTLAVSAILWIAGIIILSFVLQPVLERLAPDSDWTQFKSNLAAVGIGIPAGLWIARKVEYWRLGEERRQGVARRRMIFQQLQQELEFNRNECEQTLDFTDRNAPERFVPYLDLRIQTWESLAASGGLQLIDDPNLLSQIAVAYHASITVNAWRRPLRDNFASLDFNTAGRGLETAARIVPLLRDTTGVAVEVLKTTLNRVGAALDKLSAT